MSRFNRVSRIPYFILLFLALLIVPAVHAQDTTSHQILYAVGGQDAGGIIYTLDVDTGLKTEIGTIHNLSDAGWSPDGKFVYLLSYSQRLPRLTLVNVETKQRETLLDPLADISCWLPISWSPDGQWLTYTAQTDSDPLLKIYNPNMGDIQVLKGGDPNDDFPDWSPDNRYATYRLASPTPSDQMAVWDTQTQRTISTLNVDPAKQLQWSPTENRIAYQEAGSKSVIIYNLSDGTKQKYDHAKMGDWSPDGRFLTIYDSKLLVIDVNTEKPVEFDGDISGVGFGQPWSADSRYLVASGLNVNADSTSTIYILDLVQKRILPTGMKPTETSLFTWSPMDEKFAFAAGTDLVDGASIFTHLWTFNVNDFQSHQYVAQMPWAWGQTLFWSPGGRYITVETSAGVGLFDSKSNQLNWIMEDDQSFSWPYWSPDGAKIALMSDDDIYMFTPENHDLENITNTPDETDIFLGWRGDNRGHSLISPCGET
ncbi:MAG: PD40 domain-containing protein [Anaerolineae bacterium]|nr:PD40 domain-containing protein [Anaerolineae bacterium]